MSYKVELGDKSWRIIEDRKPVKRIYECRVCGKPCRFEYEEESPFISPGTGCPIDRDQVADWERVYE